MPKTFSKPWYGVAIPCIIIASIGYGSQAIIFRKFPISDKSMNIFQIELIILWLTYYIAIKTGPGYSNLNDKYIESNEYKTWKTYCNKCKIPKPERAHHCKTCNRCVLAMDHHCPWTMNCVGLNNFASFIRFLVSVIVATSTLMYHLVKHWLYLYKNRSVFTYKVTYFDVAALFVFTAADFMVWFTIAALFFRCFKNQIVKGMTQIELWEMERIESLGLNDKLMPILLTNVGKVFGIDFINDKEWFSVGEKLFFRSKRMFHYNYTNFPYDNGIFENFRTFMGPFYGLLLPWSNSSMNYLRKYPKNDIALVDPKFVAEKTENCVIDMILSLPWPPDGNKSNKPMAAESEQLLEKFAVSTENGKKPRFIDPRMNLKRNEWYNEYGEDLAYFGVEDDVE